MLSRTTTYIPKRRLLPATSSLSNETLLLTNGIHRLSIHYQKRTTAVAFSSSTATIQNTTTTKKDTNNNNPPPPSLSTTKIKTTEKWSKMYTLLSQYVTTHKNALVPTKGYAPNPALGRWVDQQRRLHRTNSLSENQISLLNSLGFVWEVYDLMWETRFEELKEFVKRHGTANVPLEDPYQSLSVWVSHQRYQYKLFQQQHHHSSKHKHKNKHKKSAETSKLTQERINRLNSLHFTWDLHEQVWNERYNELIQYKAQHGDCLVPKEYASNYTLGRWVEYQRQHYRLYQKGFHKKSSMTKERIEKLNQIEFVWYPYDYLWEKQYQALRDFKEVNGHVVVTKRTCGDMALVRWMEKQRAGYRKWMEGKKKGGMKEERRVKLEALGFTLL